MVVRSRCAAEACRACRCREAVVCRHTSGRPRGAVTTWVLPTAICGHACGVHGTRGLYGLGLRVSTGEGGARPVCGMRKSKHPACGLNQTCHTKHRRWGSSCEDGSHLRVAFHHKRGDTTSSHVIYLFSRKSELFCAYFPKKEDGAHLAKMVPSSRACSSMSKFVVSARRTCGLYTTWLDPPSVGG